MSNQQRTNNNQLTMNQTAKLKPIAPEAQLLDLRGTPCPINFVRTKLCLEQMEQGQLLEVWLDPGEPIEQVPESLKIEGYSIESIENRGTFFNLLVRC